PPRGEGTRPRAAGPKRSGAGLLRPRGVLHGRPGSALRGGARSGSGLHDHLAVDNRQALARLVVHAHGLLLAFVAVGHVVTDHLVLGTERNAVRRLAVAAHGAGGAVGVAIGHVVADHGRGLGGVGDGAAVGLDALHNPAAHMVAVHPVADVAAGHGAGRGRDLLAVAAAHLVADQATDHRTGDGAADVTVALGQPFLHHHVLTDLARRGGGAGRTHRVA